MPPVEAPEATVPELIQSDCADRPMGLQSCFSLREDPCVRTSASRGRLVSFELELAGKPSGHWSGQQHMLGLFHHKPRCRDGMDKAFEGGDRACS